MNHRKLLLFNRILALLGLMTLASCRRRNTRGNLAGKNHSPDRTNRHFARHDDKSAARKPYRSVAAAGHPDRIAARHGSRNRTVAAVAGWRRIHPPDDRA